MGYPANVLEMALRQLGEGRRVALAVVVATRGSTPQPPGTLACINEDAQMVGTLGGGCIEAEVRRRAVLQLREGSGGLFSFDLDFHSGRDEGMICGGRMDVAVDVLTGVQDADVLRQTLEHLRTGEASSVPVRVKHNGQHLQYLVHLEDPPKLVIAGGGHIARVLAELTVLLGFDVTVIDDREDFANPRRFPPPVQPVARPIGPALHDWPIDANTYVVIVTRGHLGDEAALAEVVDSAARYIGMIGSRRKIDVIYRDLLESGTPRERLNRVHAPIGIDIHAVTTEEIALSIAAQLTAIRRQNVSASVEGPFLPGLH